MINQKPLFVIRMFWPEVSSHKVLRDRQSLMDYEYYTHTDSVFQEPMTSQCQALITGKDKKRIGKSVRFWLQDHLNLMVTSETIA